jgi:DNA (cytosine-5)-methyltransferase 1
MKIFSTFSWIGGFELGILQAIWKENVEIIGYAEIDKFSSAVLAYRFRWVKNYGDISRIDTNELPDFDVLVGGSPCQDLSISKTIEKACLVKKVACFWNMSEF